MQISGDNLCELESSFSKLEVNVDRASGFAASKCKVAMNCGYTATFPVPFMRPPLSAGRFDATLCVSSRIISPGCYCHVTKVLGN